MTPVKRIASLFSLLVLTALLVVACGPAAQPAAAPQPEITAEPQAESAATAQPEPAVPSEPAGDSSGLRTFAIVPEESQAAYFVDEEFFADALTKYGISAGQSNTTGSTQEIAGQLQLDLGNLSAPLGDNRFTVQINTLKSNQGLRDRWIRSNGPKLNGFPTAEFVATGVEGAPASYMEGQEVQFKLPGNLTVRNITQPVTFDVTATLEGNTISGTATTRARLSDFGIEPPNFANTLVVGDQFTIEVQITAREQ